MVACLGVPVKDQRACVFSFIKYHGVSDASSVGHE